MGLLFCIDAQCDLSRGRSQASLITVTDITIHAQDDEPRILDIDLAERLGMKVPRKIRTDIIEANRAELEAFGPLRRERLQTSPMGETDSLVDVSIREFLGRSEKPKATKAQPVTRVDAEHVMKLQRLADSTANENEAAVAQSKLDDFASRFDMTAEEAVVKSRKELDLDWIEKEQSFGTFEKTASTLVEKALAKKQPAELVRIIVLMVLANPENLNTIKDHLK